MRSSLNPQDDKNWNLPEKKIDKTSLFIDNSLKAELLLEPTMRLNSKKKTRATRNPEVATKAYKTLF